MKCINCEKEIPLARLKALPQTKHCVNCSTEQPKFLYIETAEQHGNLHDLAPPVILTAEQAARFMPQAGVGYDNRKI